MIKLIKDKTGYDLAVLKNDTHVSKWVEEQRSIRVDRLLERVLPMIKPGWTVVDAGANIGDWTVPLAETVGAAGKVLAFEPLPPTYACLMVNVRELPQVSAYPYALYDINSRAIMGVYDNAGVAYVSETSLTETGYQVVCCPLDSWRADRLDFIKLDVEGSEHRLLQGARSLIGKFRPLVVCELNRGALARFGNVSDDILSFFASRDYRMEFFDPKHTLDMEQTDVLFLPR